MKTATPVLIHAAAITVRYSCSVTQAEIRVGDYHAPGDGLLTMIRLGVCVYATRHCDTLFLRR